MIVVTGGAGFIGANIVAELSRRSEPDIVVCDRLGRGEKWRNIAKAEIAAIVAPERLIGFLDGTGGGGVRAVIHMGAISDTTEANVDLLVEQNIDFTLGLWRWCAEREVRLIYASSAATYGDGGAGFDDDPSPEALARLRPLNAYGWSKHVIDRRIVGHVRAGEAAPPQWVGLKLFNVFGPGEVHKGAMRSVALQLYQSIAAGQAASLFRSHRPEYGDGEQMRDFIYVKDCVDVVMWCLEHPDVSGLFNLGGGQARSFNDMARAVFAALDAEPRITYRDTPASLRAKYQYFTQAPMARLRAAGYERPFSSLEEGIGAYVRGYLETDDPYP
jgi:ADP-L-glycero-D-manno-heptose 6-epimerase